MKVLLKLLIIFISTTLTANSYAFPKLPFCPAGGPPGWMNYFNDKRDQNTWRRYSQSNSPVYNQPASSGPYYRYGSRPAYRPNYNRPYNNSVPPSRSH